MKRLIFLVLVILCSFVVYGEQQTIDYFRAPTNLVGAVDVFVGSAPKLTFTPDSGAHTYHVKTSYLGPSIDGTLTGGRYKIALLNENGVEKISSVTTIGVGTNLAYTAQFVYVCDGVCREQAYAYKYSLNKENWYSNIRKLSGQFGSIDYPNDDVPAYLDCELFGFCRSVYGSDNELFQEYVGGTGGQWNLYVRCPENQIISDYDLPIGTNLKGCGHVSKINDQNVRFWCDDKIGKGDEFGYLAEWSCITQDLDGDGFYPPQDCDDTNNLLTTFCPEDLSGTATTCNGDVSYGVDAYSSWNSVCSGLVQGGTGGIGTGCCEAACGAAVNCDEKGSEDPLCAGSCGVTENCKNGIDDNKDGRVDNADPVCDPDIIAGRCGLEGYVWVDDATGGKCCGDDAESDNFNGISSACVGGEVFDNGVLVSPTQLVVDGSVVVCGGANLCQGIDVLGYSYYCSSNGWSSNGYSGVKASERTSLKEGICCASDSCNSNGACIENQRDNPTSASIDGNRCWDGGWVSANEFVSVKAWDDTTTGLCKRDPKQCLSLDFDDVAGGCFDVNGYVGDHYCINSGTTAIWTSRTKYLVEDMLKYVSDKGVTDYSLICDSADKVLNDIDYNIYTATGIYSVVNYLNNVNNICVLKYDDEVLLGTTLNSYGSDFDFFETIDLDDVGAEKTIDCSSAGTGYFRCSGGDVVFNKDLGVVVFGAKSSFGGSTTSFFRGLIDGIVGFFTSSTDVDVEISLISDIDEFNVLYFNKAGTKSVFGVSEYVSGNSVMSVQYNGFSTGFCGNFGGFDCGVETVGSNAVTRVFGDFDEGLWKKNVVSLRLS